MSTRSEQLIDAIRQGDAATAARLLDADPTLVHARTQGGQTAALLAVYHRRPALLDLLLERGATLDVCEAAAAGDVARVRECLDGDGARIEERSGDGWTPLHLAAHFGRLDVVDLLLARGADPRARSTNAMANTPLHAAVAGNASAALLERLLAHGADVNDAEGGGFTALHEAALKGNVEVASLLLVRGADVRAPSSDGHSPLALAHEHGHDEVAQLLLRAGA